LALIGFPFLAGFYSKDVILEVSFAKYTLAGHFSFVLGILAAFCTAFYSVRVLFLVFLSQPNGNKNIIFNAHEGSWKLTLPLFILSILSVFVGYISKDLFIGFGTDFWGSAIWVLPTNYLLSDIEFINTKYKILPLIFTFSGAFFAYFLYAFYLIKYFSFKNLAIYKIFYNFFNKKWFIDRLYTEFIVQNVIEISFSFFYKQIDRGLLEKIGPSGIINFLNFLITSFKGFQTGFVLTYLTFFVLSIVFILIALFFVLN